ncbi:MAG: competence/damage-inducible protein A [Halodesulfurarchaeum sp.]
MDAALLTVGDELLAGETENTNASWLARRLRERGVDLRRIVVVPDDIAAIADSVSSLSARYDAVLVTGGIGPTHDDVTMEGVAEAFDVQMLEHPDARAYFENHTEYAAEELVAGTGDLPAGARLLPNDEGVAPGAVMENVYVLPGVPEEMRCMFSHVEEEFAGTPVRTATVRTDNPESALIEVLAELRERFDVSVGSYPGEEVTIKIHSPDREETERAAAWLAERV